jgi:PIN domain nuclease of toxin-antitoxin system
MDTHVVVHSLSAPQRLSTDQLRVMREAHRQGETVALSAYSLEEIAMLAGGSRKGAGIDRIFGELETNPMFRVLPITIPIAADAGALNLLRDPGDGPRSRPAVADFRSADHRFQIGVGDRLSFAILTEHSAQAVRDFADRRIPFAGVENPGHQIIGAAGGFVERL